MWCSACQQDVPGLGSPATEGLRCGKCGGTLAVAITENTADEAATVAANTLDNLSLERLLRESALADDDWALEAELRGIQHLVGSLRTSLPADGRCSASTHETASEPALRRRFDPPSENLPSGTLPAAPAPAVAARTQPATWLVISLSLGTFACGGLLLAWSVIGQRNDLWPIGLPLTLVGQAGLILGLVLQLDTLWQTNRQAADAISHLDDELSRVRHATTLLTTSHSTSGQSFYAHMAEGASPHILLADLKGQLDLLAQQMAARQR